MAYDFGVLIVLLFCLYRGAMKGIAWQVAGIGALVLCFIFATPLSRVVAPSIPLEAPLNRWIAMLGIYLFFSFATFAIARAFREILEKARFQEFDKHLGAIFGLLKGALLSLVFTFFIVAISVKARDYILNTYTGYTCAIIADRLDPVMPEELHTILAPYIHSLDPAAKGDLKNQHGITRKQTSTDNSSENDPLEDSSNSRSQKPRSGNTPGARDLSRSITGEDDSEAGDLLTNAVKETARKTGESALKKVGQGVDDFFDQLTAKENSAGNGTEDDAPIQPQRTNAQPTSRERYRYRPQDYEPLIQQMSQVLARQNRMRVDEARYQLEVEMKGLPKSVGAAVLDDLRYDLLQEGDDPDPQTDDRTPMSDRVRRQIRGTGVPRDRLTQGMRSRLDAIERD